MLTDNFVEIDSLEEIVSERILAQDIQKKIKNGAVYYKKNVIGSNEIDEIVGYLRNVASNSLPNYCAITEGCPNHHRLNAADERAYVRGVFHQFSFFPWNQDFFNLFNRFRLIYEVKNILSGLPKTSFLGSKPERDCTARLSFQFYPRGGGMLRRHNDPLDFHQLVVPTMLLSEKGVNFLDGGGYVGRGDSEPEIFIDEIVGKGGVVFFNAQTDHGVKPIDPGAELNWLKFEGRWILLFAVNKLQGKTSIEDSMEKPQFG